MECNKDEASRAKEIAEKKFMAKDIAGAMKFALKAQNLYPGLEGISQTMATLGVYSSAENKVNGEVDWYGILGVDQQADEEAVRRQYRKLALMLHPDKNKAIGADGAFKLISEAWSLLSDKTKRAVYDQKQKVCRKVSIPAAAAGSSATQPSNGFYNFTNSTAKVHKNTTKASHSSIPPKTGQSSTTAKTSHSSTPHKTAHSSAARTAPHKSKRNTFWTVCHGCKMQYEYLRVYLNHNLLCPNCHEPFLAVETPPPSMNGTKVSTTWNFSQQNHNSSHQGAHTNTLNSGRSNMNSLHVGTGEANGIDSYNQTNFQWSPFSKSGGASTAAQAASVVQQAYEKVRREREEAQAATKREEALKRKNHSSKRTGAASSSGTSAKRRRGMDGVGPSNNAAHASNQVDTGSGAAGTSNVSALKRDGVVVGKVNGITKPYGTRDISQLEIQSLLVEKAKKEIIEKLKDWRQATVAKPAVKEATGDCKENDKGEVSLVNLDIKNQNKSDEPLGTVNGVHNIKSSSVGSRPESVAETLESMSINVPDPDFYDFDKDRTERCFSENQVWAAYDNDDGMPRYYAMIHDVISLIPFKMRISWLNSKNNSELGPLNWVGSGFSKTCGDFRVGKHEIYSSLNSFSHKVPWIKGSRGVIQVYPRKGDVWALYRHWSPDWNELTPDEVIHKYEMVEVLEDFTEELGVTVTPLIKVAGFKTVFHQHLDPNEIRRIPKEEMFRFSHHVPSHLLTGHEGQNAPKGCRELDPAATPADLLLVIGDIKADEILENDEELENEQTVNGVEQVGNNEVEIGSKNLREDEKGNHRDSEAETMLHHTELEKDERVEDAVERIVDV